MADSNGGLVTSPSERATVTRSQLVRDYSRGGFVWTRLISQRLGALIAAPAVRFGVHPSTVTLTALLVGVASSVAAILLLPGQRAAAGIVALVGWQVAYGLDCADGQVARATNRTSPAGARLDLTADFGIYAGTVVTLIVGSAQAAPQLLLVTAAIAHLYQLLDEATGRGGDATVPAIDRTGMPYQAAGVVRDGGVQRAAAALGIMAGPLPTAVVLVALGAVGAVQFVGRIGVLYQRSR